MPAFVDPVPEFVDPDLPANIDQLQRDLEAHFAATMLARFFRHTRQKLRVKSGFTPPPALTAEEVEADEREQDSQEEQYAATILARSYRRFRVLQEVAPQVPVRSIDAATSSAVDFEANVAATMIGTFAHAAFVRSQDPACQASKATLQIMLDTQAAETSKLEEQAREQESSFRTQLLQEMRDLEDRGVTPAMSPSVTPGSTPSLSSNSTPRNRRVRTVFV